MEYVQNFLAVALVFWTPENRSFMYTFMGLELLAFNQMRDRNWNFWWITEQHILQLRFFLMLHGLLSFHIMTFSSLFVDFLLICYLTFT